ncbi:MAG: LysE family translocator [Saprospiraceae bacterium]|jgi:threonine/homoserine/homoserine lactone efflux protein
MDYLIQGILLGLLLSYLPGPLFFGLLQVGIERGFKAAVAYATGIWISDVLFVLLTYFGVAYLVALTKIQGFNIILAMIGGGILIVSGLGTLLAKPTYLQHESKIIDHVSKFGIFLRGFFFNLFNPGTIFFWLGVSSQLSAHQPGPQKALLFFSGMWFGLVSSDILKAYLAKQIKEKMTGKILWYIKILISLILIGFGFFLIFSYLWKM